MHLLRFQRCLAAFRLLPFGSFLSKRQKTKRSQDYLSPTVSTYLHGEQRGRSLETRPAPLHRHAEPQLKLKPQLQHKLLRSLRSLRPRCLRSPNNHNSNSNHNCNTNSSARCARSGHAAYGLQAQKEQIDLLATLGELFAPSSLSAVFGSFSPSAFWFVPL